MRTELLIDVLGWIGAVALLCAYALVSNKKVEGDSPAYQTLNLVGSIFLIANTFFYGAYPSVAVNLFWTGIAVFTLLRLSRRTVSK